MCGLLAFVSAAAGGDSPGSARDTADAVARASHVMRHRGPDEPGTWVDPAGTVVFGFNRLSIIDIAHSHQPLRWGPPESPGRYELVFNGEIYNYLELRAELAERHVPPAREQVLEVPCALAVAEEDQTPDAISGVHTPLPLP